ncbi:Uncharacterized membrane protein YqiK, contains Band7/PHB/SPFH domain [Verrucomicrobium sp. GAS474]|uniref:SPFH domain-containing protein n=1 Tax=Verrucomicrobium sp. GAS474 TaxID=1882831 RepID=UPI00087B985C|nr:SPFH domain-containing protein [Verrucomicrobium sp. GAS474]SDU26800.1 Uncharacterized membrane protein YqiK, contains Band7/PHB/SPFH domain [Verrucomicrobium sp. GAS474]
MDSNTILIIGVSVVALILLLIALVCYKAILRLFGVVIIPNDAIGLLNKKWVLFGEHRSLPDGEIIALHGEAGWQADTLSPGVHFWLWPWQFAVSIQPFTTVRGGKVGVVEARGGNPLRGGKVLAKKVACDSFQNARAFLTDGGERGTQITIIPPGDYRINTALFTITEADVLDIPDNMVGVVTTKEGFPLATGDIAGKEIENHNMYQDAQSFLDNGGSKGLQEQVLLAGRYFINPAFARIELKPMTEVPIAYAGVVIAYVGEKGVDLSGDSFKHGNLVGRGQKGVWAEPLDPGKYPINPYTHKVENVPTANVVLNWATGKSESHKLDEKLSTITVRSSDGFRFNLDVSQIIHIPRNAAPKVIARFGNMANLVTQVLEPTIGNYFRNAAQGADVIDFLKQRQQRQADARSRIAGALTEYDVVAVDTLIGDIVPPEDLMKTLTDRKIAEQETVTYQTQKVAEDNRMAFQQAKSLADTQARVVDAERSVSIADFAAKAAVKKASGEADAKKINAAADAEVLSLVGDAEGRKITAVGTAEAEVIRLKTEAVGQGNYATIEIGKALAASGMPLVPHITVAGGGEKGEGGSLVSVLLANLIAKDHPAQPRVIPPAPSA